MRIRGGVVLASAWHFRSFVDGSGKRNNFEFLYIELLGAAREINIKRVRG